MASYPFRNRPSGSRPPTRALPVIAIGQRVFVNCPGDRLGSVFLGDENGKVLSSVYLSDGHEVEVVAWRPGGVSNTRYRVRAASSGADGWLPAGNLRKSLVPPPEPEPAPAPVAADTDARRFGERNHVDRSSAPTVAGPPDHEVGRRFGQRF